MEIVQNFIGTIGTTSVTEIETNDTRKFVLTNNKVFKYFNFTQEYYDEDTAWNRAEAISRFEKDFAEAHYCSVSEDGEEIEFWFADKEPKFYFVSLGGLCQRTITGLRISKPSKSFILPTEVRACVDYINLKLK